jgi:hypothetical protein
MSYLQNYMTWNTGTEVPENYYFWSGISSLAALVNGQVWIRMGRYQIFPNMYIVLIGPPGNGKTSALRRAEKLTRSFKDVSLSAQSETAEGLVRFMRDSCVKTINLEKETVPFTPVTCYLSELSNFFGRDPGGMIDLLTGIWDCGGENYHRRTKGQGEDVLPRPNLNLLGCTTQDWITTYLKSDIIGGGFTRRVVFVNEMMTDDTLRVSWPDDSPETLKAKANCISYGTVLREIKGEMQYGVGARAWWDKWYNTRTIPREPDVRGYHKSKPTLLLKVAVLVALSKAPERMVNVDDLEVALALLDKSEIHLLKVFQGIGKNPLNVIATQIMTVVNSAAERKCVVDGKKCLARIVPRKDLEGLFYRDARNLDLKDVFDHLYASGKATRSSVPMAGGIAKELVVSTDSIREIPDASQEGTTPT